MTFYPIPDDPDFQPITGEPAPALARHSTPRPIPVTERLPGADDMLDDECWWFLPANKYQGAAWILHPFDLYIPTRARHWLPAHALPLPGVEE